MMALLLASALLVSTSAPTSAPTSDPTTDRCQGTLDRTDECEAPAKATSTTAPDPVPPPEAPARDPMSITRQLSLAALGAAALGTGALVWTQVEGGLADLDDGQRDAVRIGGVSFLAASGAILAATTALTVFDPSTGKLRFNFEDGD